MIRFVLSVIMILGLWVAPAVANIGYLKSSNTYYWVYFESIPGSRSMELKFVLNDPIMGPTYECPKSIKVQLTDGTSYTLNNFFAKGNFLTNLTDEQAKKLATCDMAKITIGTFTFELPKGSSEILRKNGLAKGLITSTSSSAGNKSSTSSAGKTATKSSATTSGNNAPIVKITKLVVKKGVVCNGYPSLQFDATFNIKNPSGEKYRFILWIKDLNGNSIINNGDGTSAGGIKYFMSQEISATNANRDYSTWWKVYKTKLNLPNSTTKIKAHLSVIDSKVNTVAKTYEVTFDFANNNTETFTF